MLIKNNRTPIQRIHYNFNHFKEKQHLITLLKLLIYVLGLKYNTQRLRAKYQQFRFPLHDFLKYTGKTLNHY
jgi:hypothetical protein